RSKRDWSSDVCSSDLTIHEIEPSAKPARAATPEATAEVASAATSETTDEAEPVVAPTPQEQAERAGDSAPAATVETAAETTGPEIGRASCRERVAAPG